MGLFVQLCKKYSSWFSGILVLYFILFVLSTSVTQDDYATLSDLSSDGFWGPTFGVWNILGGNISSVIPRTLALGFGFSPALPLGLVIYSGLTLLLIILSINYLLTFFIPRFREFVLGKRLPLVLALSLGFEGLFTPGQLGVLGFSAAAGVHIWPVCFIILGHKFFLKNSRLSFFGTILAFLYAGNSNIPEGALAVIVVIALSYRTHCSSGLMHSGKRFIGTLVLLLTTITGLLTIFLAPGFKARLETAGVSLALNDLITGVLQAGAFFSIDILTHPFIYLATITGFIIGGHVGLQTAWKPIQEFSLIALLYFLLLIVGAGVAYPAWHQTFGLYVFLLPLAFSLGVFYSERRPGLRAIVSALLVPILILSSLATVRSGYTVMNRKIAWQSNYEHNICIIKAGSNETLRGSEIVYPPKSLGVEDINSWPWMADSFKNWIVNSGFTCKK